MSLPHLSNVTKATVLYSQYKSVWVVGEKMGVAGQTVHRWLTKAGVKLSNSVWTTEEMAALRAAYAKAGKAGGIDLDAVAAAVGRDRMAVALKASRLGLTNLKRKKHEDRIKVDPPWKGGAHPRGMAGKQHSGATKMQISWSSQARWDSMSEEQRLKHTEKGVITRIRNNTPPTARTGASWKAGWREVGGKRFFARSRWEANVARYLEFRKKHGDIKEWEHEPHTFWFEKIMRGVRSYKPDFRVTRKNGTAYWLEVKGWMDARSRTTLKRMKKYHPKEEIDVLDSARYKVLNAQCRRMVPGWE